MNGAIAVDLVGNIERAAAVVGDRNLALLCRLEGPGDVRELRMGLDLRCSQRGCSCRPGRGWLVCRSAGMGGERSKSYMTLCWCLIQYRVASRAGKDAGSIHGGGSATDTCAGTLAATRPLSAADGGRGFRARTEWKFTTTNSLGLACAFKSHGNGCCSKPRLRSERVSRWTVTTIMSGVSARR